MINVQFIWGLLLGLLLGAGGMTIATVYIVNSVEYDSEDYEDYYEDCKEEQQ